MLSICVFKWGDKYSTEHVRRMHNMLARNLTIPWQFVVITDDPEGDRAAHHRIDVKFVRLWDEMRDTKYCGVRIRAFGADMMHRIGPRFAWVDLDVVITRNVDHLFSRSEDFVALATPNPPMPYNGSLVMMDAGARAQVLAKWTPDAYAETRAYWDRLGVRAGAESDEGWMGRVLGDKEATFTQSDGIYYLKRLAPKYKLPIDACMVVMNGRKADPSFHEWQKTSPWIKEHWR